MGWDCSSRGRSAKTLLLRSFNSNSSLGFARRSEKKTVANAPRGQWFMVRALPLGREFHPLSVAFTTADKNNKRQVVALVSKTAGNWSQALCKLATRRFKVEVEGPFLAGGGSWSLITDEQEEAPAPALLLLAGGTGIAGWLPGLNTAASTGRKCRFVWCVKSEADYLAMASRIPESRSGVDVTVFVTQSTLPHGQKIPHSVLGKIDEIRTPSASAKRSLATPSILSLAMVLVGLSICHWGLNDGVQVLDRAASATLFSYTAINRFGPVALIIGAVVGIHFVGKRFLDLSSICHGKSKGEEEESDEETGILLEVPPLSNHHSSESDCRHSVISGRPCFQDLIRAAERDTDDSDDSDDSEGAELIVAACGPESFIEASRKAAAEFADVTFVGNEPNW